MKKRIAAFILLLCLLPGLTACGGKAKKMPKLNEIGLPVQYEKERERTMEAMWEHPEGVEVIRHKGKLVEAMDELPGYRYFGEMKGAKPHGYGVLYEKYNDQLVFAGEFKKGEPCGYGMVLEDGCVTEGDDSSIYAVGTLWDFRVSGTGFMYPYQRDDWFSGDGYVRDAREFFGSIPVIFYVGELKNSVPDGKGTSFYADMARSIGPVYYEGTFKNGMFDGEGVSYYATGGVMYKGDYRKGEYHGKGVLYEEDGSVKYKGRFSKGIVDE